MEGEEFNEYLEENEELYDAEDEHKDYEKSSQKDEYIDELEEEDIEDQF